MNCQLYGALYDCQADVQWELCPSGWHVPSVADMTDLAQSVNVVAGEANGASYFKQRIFNDSMQWEGANMSGFSALPGGRRNFQTLFNAGAAKAGKNGYWMALGGNNDQNIMYALKMDEADNATISSADFRRGVSVRCVLNHE